MRALFVQGASALVVGGLLVLAPVVPAAAAENAGEQELVDLSGGLTPDDLVQRLVGDDVTVSNVQYTGDSSAAGLADGFADVFGIPGGVVLATGGFASSPGIIRGPNSATATSLEFFAPGDRDLEALAGDVTHDAAVLEFDIVPATDEFRLDYVFGSDEYHEYVGIDSDVFAIFVDGENCAVVGDDAEPVTINTVNLGSNADLFVDNDFLSASPYNTEFDGFTTVLSCVADVVAGETTHVKLAIADGGTSVIDTGVIDSAVIIAPGTTEASPSPTPTPTPTDSPSPTDSGTPTPSPTPAGDPGLPNTGAKPDLPDTGAGAGPALATAALLGIAGLAVLLRSRRTTT